VEEGDRGATTTSESLVDRSGPRGPEIYEHRSGSQDLKGDTATGPTRCSYYYYRSGRVESLRGRPDRCIAFDLDCVRV
jgi:hypothetical protein